MNQTFEKGYYVIQRYKDTTTGYTATTTEWGGEHYCKTKKEAIKYASVLQEAYKIGVLSKPMEDINKIEIFICRLLGRTYIGCQFEGSRYSVRFKKGE